MSFDPLVQTFKDETLESLNDLEVSLMALESRPEDADLLNAAFRVMHTIKGSAAMFGFEQISDFTHEAETVFDRVRNHEIPVTPHLISLTLQAKDYIRAIVSGEGDAPDPAEIMQGYRALLGGEAASVAPETIDESSDEEGQAFLIRFRPEPNILATGTNLLPILRELADLGDLRTVLRSDALPTLADLQPDQVYVWWDFILTGQVSQADVEDVFMFVSDNAEVQYQPLEHVRSTDTHLLHELERLLISHGDADWVNVRDAVQSYAESHTHGQVIKDEAASQLKMLSEGARTSSIRVPTERINKLVDLVGELVIAHSRLVQLSSQSGNGDIRQLSEEMGRLVGDLRDESLDIRMVPIGTTFSRFQRLVRDLARDIGRDVIMETSGGDTELDATLIERLGDPLVHIIRNAVDHGIEPPDEREAAGKPRQGTIHLSASQSGPHVVITIQDDGHGLDLKRIREKAISKGLISPDAALSDKEAAQLIFAAGFSTADQVTNVSGRGVGMDVVRQSIHALRGTVEIDSELGRGTTIHLTLPLTLAIIEGLLVLVDDQEYVLPLYSVEECLEFQATERTTSGAKEHVRDVRGQMLPMVRLREWLKMPGDLPDIEQIVMTQVGSRRAGLIVDSVIGKHQTVIKPIGHIFEDMRAFSGATILGDGRVALILDVSWLITLAEEEHHRAIQSHTRELVVS